jgi:hypothetical protein
LHACASTQHGDIRHGETEALLGRHDRAARGRAGLAWAMAQVGCQMGVQIGASIANTRNLRPSFLLGEPAWHWQREQQPDAGVRGGCDLHLAGAPWFVGAFGEYNWQGVKTTLALPVRLSTPWRCYRSWPCHLRTSQSRARPWPRLRIRHTECTDLSGAGRTQRGISAFCAPSIRPKIRPRT